VKFTDLLHAGAFLSAAAATALAAGTVLFGVIDNEQDVVLLCTIWWLMAATGALLGSQSRGTRTSRQISRLMVDAKPQRMQEEPRVARTVANRLWPLGFITILSLVATALVGPQVAGVTVGFLVIWALMWHGQESAVKAVEERDGVAFHVVVDGPLKPLRLVRGPGLRRDLPTQSKPDSTEHPAAT
jgi:hypothetical protein